MSGVLMSGVLVSARDVTRAIIANTCPGATSTTFGTASRRCAEPTSIARTDCPYGDDRIMAASSVPVVGNNLRLR